MNINKVTVISFSPTGGSKKYAEEIASKISSQYDVIDITNPKVREKRYEFKSDDLVIFAAPVYSGRLPMIKCGIFDNIFGNNTPAIFTVSYGNREFEDALLEEKEICEKNGFKGIAASAWIAPHTFSDKIASNRPDASDFNEIEKFSAKVKTIINGEFSETDNLDVSGNNPYRSVSPMPVHPSGNEKCIKCGKCASLCPVGAIDVSSPDITDGDKCINCLACVKSCPVNARGIFHPMFEQIQQKLEGMLLKVRKEPSMFYIK